MDWRTLDVQPWYCLGRYEGTEEFLGRSSPQSGLLPSLPEQRSTLDKCLVQRRGWHQQREMKSDHVTVGGP